MKTLKKNSLVIIFLGIVGTGYSQDKSGSTTFDFNQPFLLEIGIEAAHGNLTITFVDRRDVMGQNLGEENATPTSYYSYILEISDKKDAKTFHVKSYEIGNEEATIDWKEYQFSVLKSQQDGKILQLQISQIEMRKVHFEKPFQISLKERVVADNLHINFKESRLDAHDTLFKVPVFYYTLVLSEGNKKETYEFEVFPDAKVTFQWKEYEFSVLKYDLESLNLLVSKKKKN